MSDISISIPAGESKRLLTAGKYCPSNILVTAEGSSEDDTGLDTSDATATAPDILYNKTAYANGKKLTGTMPNWGQQNIVITPQSGPFTGSKGYRESLTARAEYTPISITPNKTGHEITATTKFFSKVTVAAIPDAYHDVSSVTATSSDVLTGKKIVNSSGATVNGSMPNNGAVSASIDPGEKYTIPAGYHNGLGVITALAGSGGSSALPAAIEKIAAGVYTSTSFGFSGNVSISHGLGVTPDFFVLMYMDGINNQSYSSDMGVLFYSCGIRQSHPSSGGTTQTCAIQASYITTSGYAANGGSCATSALFSSTTFKPGTSTPDVSYIMPSGARYVWICGTFANVTN